jgi:hypothetical protein
VVTVGPDVPLWRVGRESDTLSVDPKYQGSGRFDDPTHLLGVLYSADSLRTCLLELIAAWKDSPARRAIQRNIPDPTSEDEERDAERDRAIAEKPMRVPPRLYERVCLSFIVDPQVDICNLLDVATRSSRAGDEGISRELRRCGFVDLDLGAILAPHRPLTQATAHAIMRSTNEGAGIFSASRHDGNVVNLFVGGRFEPSLVPISDPQRLSDSNSDVIAAERELGLAP